MAGRFVVEVEAAAGMADRQEAAVMVAPAAIGRAGLLVGPQLRAFGTSLGLPLTQPPFAAAAL